MNARACTRVVSFGCRTHVRPMAPILRLLTAILNDTTSRFFSSGPVFFRLRSTHASRCSSKWSRFGVPYPVQVCVSSLVRASQPPPARSRRVQPDEKKQPYEEKDGKTKMENSEDRFRRKDKRGRRRTGKGREGGAKSKRANLRPTSAGGAQQASLSSPLSKPNLPHPTRYPLRYAIPLPHLLLAVCGALTSLCHLL